MNKRKLFFGFTLVSLFGLGILSHWNFMNRNETRVNILFNENRSNFLNDSLVNKLLIQKIANEDNQSNLKLDLRELEEYIELLPEVHKAEVFSDIEGNVNVKIFESTALLRIQNEGFYLDPFGKKILFSNNYIPIVPIYSGYFKDDKIEDLVKLSKLIISDSYLKSEFVEIWNEKFGYSLRLRNHDFVVFWGNLKNIKEKRDKLKAFCAYATENEFINKPKQIDLTIYDQIVSTH